MILPDGEEMGLFDGKPGCKICGKTEADGCDCWEGFDDYRKAESINDRIATLTDERDRYKAALEDVIDWFQMTADDTEHDCGNWDGGSSTSCPACQYAQTVKHYEDILK